MGRVMRDRLPRTAFIGLGSQGGPMAERMLAGGYPLSVWARRASVTEPFVVRGAIAEPSIEMLGYKADHVGVCLASIKSARA